MIKALIQKYVLDPFNSIGMEFVDCFCPEHYGLNPRPTRYQLLGKRRPREVVYSNEVKDLKLINVKKFYIVENKKSLVVYPYSWEIKVKDQSYDTVRSHKIFLTEQEAIRDGERFLRSLNRMENFTIES